MAASTHNDQPTLEQLRHSCAHVMAQTVQELFPGTKLAIGPAIENGFYYDFDSDHKFTPDDLPKIEKRMQEIAAEKHAFICHPQKREQARRFFEQRKENYKIEILDNIPATEPISLYQQSSFIDLCRGNHVENTGQIKYFRLTHISGAYWRGDEKNPMLQRIYGTAWFNKEDLQNYLTRLEEAKKRDHRKLGTQLDLFSIHEEIGGGLIHWHHKGALIRSLIENLWKEEHLKNGYTFACTPHIASEEIYKISGHLEAYSELMYGALDVEGRPFRVKPMNCPGHIMIYKSNLHSYRELPLRIAELGTVYRFEKSGVLHGLMRVRGFTIDDAHIFLTLDQLEEELRAVLSLARRFLASFGFKDLKIMLSTRPEKYVGEPSNWDRATNALKQALENQHLEYGIDEGGGAFYGPKIDVKIKDCLGRLWQCSTVQLDFNLPERFHVTYRDRDGKDHRVVMVHRALMGSLERFMGILIEHYGGAFPLWLAPTQIKILTINEEVNGYANEICHDLRQAGIRVQAQLEQETINSKVRWATLEKVPLIGIVGKKEEQSQTISLRARDNKQIGPVKKQDLALYLKKIIKQEEGDGHEKNNFS